MTAPKPQNVMTEKEARRHLARLGLSQQAFARLIGRDASVVRRWLNPNHPTEIPGPAALLLRSLALLHSIRPHLEALSVTDDAPEFKKLLAALDRLLPEPT